MASTNKASAFSRFSIPELRPIIDGDLGDKAAATYDQVVDAEITSLLTKQQRKAREEAELILARQIGTASTDCKDCGFPISEARLKACPGAARCTECESIQEKPIRRRLLRY